VQQPTKVPDTWKKVSYVPTDVLAIHLQKGDHPPPSSTHTHSFGLPEGVLDGHHEIYGVFQGEASAYNLREMRSRRDPITALQQLFQT